MSGAAFAQGYVNFNAAANPYVVTNTAMPPLFGGSGLGGVSGPTMTNANQYYYALLIQGQTTYGVASTDTTVWDGTWTYAGIMSTNSSVLRGRIYSEGVVIYVGSIVNNLGQTWNGNGESYGYPDGVTNSIVLVGWSANMGTSWSAVSALLASQQFFSSYGTEYFGESMIGYLVPNYAMPGALVFASGPTVNGLPIYNPASNPMELYALVPEPSTLALAGLGGLSLWLFRRRK